MKGKRWVLTAAMLVAGLRLWTQVRGKAKTPFHEWAMGWGVTFFFIALVSETYPQAAGALAGTLVVGDFLVNGAELFVDLTGVVTGAEDGKLADHPFAGDSTPAAGAATTTKAAPPNRGATMHASNSQAAANAAAQAAVQKGLGQLAAGSALGPIVTNPSGLAVGDQFGN